jgi:putative transposase
MLGSWQGRHASRRGLIYHVMNRTAGRFRMLRRDADFEALERVLVETHQREPMRILSYCLMGNHWHFVVWPRRDGQLSDFFRWLTHTHTMRWRVAHRSVGDGHLYGGRFKAFAVQTGPRLADVLRYVERNALSAGLVKRSASIANNPTERNHGSGAPSRSWAWSTPYDAKADLQRKPRQTRCVPVSRPRFSVEA